VERLDLATLMPREELASSQYCLASPGRQYVVYLPEGGEVELDLSDASPPLTVEWLEPSTGKSHAGESAAGGGKCRLRPPWSGPAVLLVQKATAIP